MQIHPKVEEFLKNEFQDFLEDFSIKEGLKASEDRLDSQRYLKRSIAPHAKKLSEIFNRLSPDDSSPLEAYWGSSTNTKNLRWSYFLTFSLANSVRFYTILCELKKLGFTFPISTYRAIDFGSGPGSVPNAFLFDQYSEEPLFPSEGNWALIEKDLPSLKFAESFHSEFQKEFLSSKIDLRLFHRDISISDTLLPRKSPSFHLWCSSFFLNELEQSVGDSKKIAKLLLQAWERHVEKEGLIILSEPALKEQSRKLLEIRKHLIHEIEKKDLPYQVLLPCLGHQNCGALEKDGDWCHEESTWWRPPYLRTLDEMLKLDRKKLPYSYLVIQKTKKPLEEILPAFQNSEAKSRYRLVSPVHLEGSQKEFYLCGQSGKCKARTKNQQELGRGSILLDATLSHREAFSDCRFEKKI